MKSHASGIRAHAALHEFESRDGASRGERVQAFLRALYPTKTAQNVSADTGGRVPVNTVKTWLQRGSAPDTDGYEELWIAYGADFLAAMADDRAPDWLIQSRRARDSAKIKAEIAALELKLAGVRA